MQRFLIFSLLLLTLNASAQVPSAYKTYLDAFDFMNNGESEKALGMTNGLLSKDSLNVDYLNLKGRILEQMKRYDESFACFNKALRIDENNFEAYNNRGLLLTSLQHFDEAIRDFTTGIERGPVDSLRHMLMLNRAVAKISIRSFDAAWDDLMILYRKDSTNLGVLNNLATICDETGRGELTLGFLQRIIAVEPNNYMALGNMGFKYQEMGDYKTAIRYFDKVLQLQPGEPLSYNNRAYNKMKLGDLQGALDDVNMSIKLYPTNAYAYRNRALIAIAANTPEKACPDLQKALDLGFTTMYGEEVKNLIEKFCHR